MSVQLNHTIVWCRDKQRSARFLTDILGLPEPTILGPMLVVQFDNSVSLDYYEEDGAITFQHYAFLIGEEDFETILGRITQQGLPYWADPWKQRPNAINHRDGGRRVYFDDPDGHLLEILTQP